MGLSVLLIRPPPISTLFPYTTLFRSHGRGEDAGGCGEQASGWRCGAEAGDLGKRRRRCGRSEEHTSELQSPDHLVCRLRRDKKNNNRLRNLLQLKTPEVIIRNEKRML